MSNDKTTLADVQPGGRVRLGTPGARWAAIGEPDPHGTRYDCERAALVMGDLTDDELANAVFMHGIERQTMAELIGGATPAIAYLTAAKDRIRWLSRSLAAAESLSAQPSPATCKEGLQVQPSPGGQEYAWNIAELVRVDLDRQSCPDAYMRIAMESVVKHLAARQPVREIDEAAVLRRAAAVLYMWEDDPNLTGYMGDFKDACGILELLAQHAGPPAQAVDLGQSIPSELAPVAAALKRFGDCAEDSGSEGCDIGRDWFDALTTIGLLSRTQRSPAVWTMTEEGERLLALIDSQAVGNG